MNHAPPVFPAQVAVPAMAPAAPQRCLNCDAPRMGQYCHACGQHFLEGRLSIPQLVREFVVRTLSLERGLVHTFVDLTVRPGAMIRDYVQGRRQRYTNPVAYLLISAAVYAFVLPLWKEALVADLRKDWDPEAAAAMEAVVRISMAMESHPVASTLLLCLFFVPLLRLLFSNRTTTAESSVFAFYVFGHVMLWQGILTPIAVLVSSDVVSTLNDWELALLFLMTVFSAGGFFGARPSTFLRVGAAMAIAVLSFLFALFAGVVFLALLDVVLKAGAVPQ